MRAFDFTTSLVRLSGHKMQIFVFGLQLRVNRLVREMDCIKR
jgi:hypothetical protein